MSNYVIIASSDQQEIQNLNQIKQNHTRIRMKPETKTLFRSSKNNMLYSKVLSMESLQT